ncbi:unnamed protein product [Vitrella brassicaformis CCMP3155]|uniref:Uncharacterized protein n=1 Tax=Vitrella brassicaformis (strain CCMP3155) TaxID=1169540 RepID=A0A0G4ET05_VITBC|nr:unnamed protein product [Vitrella brassicaformis CCMP3155]|eukprot:CEM00841.1 unnamed protein product [Vitrella brassicaformis CCMP3155]
MQPGATSRFFCVDILAESQARQQQVDESDDEDDGHVDSSPSGGIDIQAADRAVPPGKPPHDDDDDHHHQHQHQQQQEEQEGGAQSDLSSGTERAADSHYCRGGLSAPPEPAPVASGAHTRDGLPWLRFDDRVRGAPSQPVTVSVDYEASPGGVLCRLVGLPSTIHSLEDQHSDGRHPTPPDDRDPHQHQQEQQMDHQRGSAAPHDSDAPPPDSQLFESPLPLRGGAGGAGGSGGGAGDGNAAELPPAVGIFEQSCRRCEVCLNDVPQASWADHQRYCTQRIATAGPPRPDESTYHEDRFPQPPTATPYLRPSPDSHLMNLRRQRRLGGGTAPTPPHRGPRAGRPVTPGETPARQTGEEAGVVVDTPIPVGLPGGTDTTHGVEAVSAGGGGGERVDGQDEEGGASGSAPVASSDNDRFYTGTEASVHRVARTGGTDSLQLSDEWLSDDSVFIMASQDGPHLLLTSGHQLPGGATHRRSGLPPRHPQPSSGAGSSAYHRSSGSLHGIIRGSDVRRSSRGGILQHRIQAPLDPSLTDQPPDEQQPPQQSADDDGTVSEGDMPLATARSIAHSVASNDSVLGGLRMLSRPPPNAVPFPCPSSRSQTTFYPRRLPDDVGVHQPVAARRRRHRNKPGLVEGLRQPRFTPAPPIDQLAVGGSKTQPGRFQPMRWSPPLEAASSDNGPPPTVDHHRGARLVDLSATSRLDGDTATGDVRESGAGSIRESVGSQPHQPHPGRRQRSPPTIAPIKAPPPPPPRLAGLRSTGGPKAKRQQQGTAGQPVLDSMHTQAGGRLSRDSVPSAVGGVHVTPPAISASDVCISRGGGAGSVVGHDEEDDGIAMGESPPHRLRTSDQSAASEWTGSSASQQTALHVSPKEDGPDYGLGGISPPPDHQTPADQGAMGVSAITPASPPVVRDFDEEPIRPLLQDPMAIIESVAATEASGGAAKDSRIMCDKCGRSFNQEALKKHKCTAQHTHRERYNAQQRRVGAAGLPIDFELCPHCDTRFSPKVLAKHTAMCRLAHRSRSGSATSRGASEDDDTPLPRKEHDPLHPPHRPAKHRTKRTDSYRAAVGYPAALYYKELLRKYPGARVIVTTRGLDGWFESAERTVFRLPSVLLSFPAYLSTLVFHQHALVSMHLALDKARKWFEGDRRRGIIDREKTIERHRSHLDSIIQHINPRHRQLRRPLPLSLAAKVRPEGPSRATTSQRLMEAEDTEGARSADGRYAHIGVLHGLLNQSPLQPPN